MSLVTPVPPGSPDWAPPTQQPGVRIISEAASGYSGGNGVVGFCGAAKSIFLASVFSGASTYFSLQVMWSLTNIAGTPLIQGDTYFFNPSVGCTVVDCLPVLAPYVYMKYTTLDAATVTVSTTVTTALQTMRGTPFVPNAGVCFDVSQIVAGGSNLQKFGAYCTPGLYSYRISGSGTAWSGTIQIGGWQNGANPSAFTAETINLAASGVATGNIVVGTRQPMVQAANTAGTSNTLIAALVGPQVTS